MAWNKEKNCHEANRERASSNSRHEEEKKERKK
jgi:hypothetical protein